MRHTSPTPAVTRRYTAPLSALSPSFSSVPCVGELVLACSPAPLCVCQVRAGKTTSRRQSSSCVAHQKSTLSKRCFVDRVASHRSMMIVPVLLYSSSAIRLLLLTTLAQPNWIKPQPQASKSDPIARARDCSHQFRSVKTQGGRLRPMSAGVTRLKDVGLRIYVFGPLTLCREATQLTADSQLVQTEPSTAVCRFNRVKPSARQTWCHDCRLVCLAQAYQTHECIDQNTLQNDTVQPQESTHHSLVQLLSIRWLLNLMATMAPHVLLSKPVISIIFSIYPRSSLSSSADAGPVKARHRYSASTSLTPHYTFSTLPVQQNESPAWIPVQQVVNVVRQREREPKLRTQREAVIL